MRKEENKLTEMCEVSDGEEDSEEGKESDGGFHSTSVVDFIELGAESEST